MLPGGVLFVILRRCKFFSHALGVSLYVGTLSRCTPPAVWFDLFGPGSLRRRNFGAGRKKGPRGFSAVSGTIPQANIYSELQFVASVPGSAANRE